MNVSGGKILSSDSFGNVIEVQCKVTKGLPAVQVVGMGNKAVEESRERVRAAFHSSKLEFPKGRVLVNLSPADLPKDGASYDLAIAVSILVASDQIPPPKQDIFVCGEIALDGSILPVRGIIGRLNSQNLSKDVFCIIPTPNGRQAMLVKNRKYIAADNLRSLVDSLNGITKPKLLKPEDSLVNETNPTAQDYSFDEVKGQELAKRALIIAASGGHNILMFGPPGTGKSMLAKALRSILPPLNSDQQLEVTHLHSLRSNNRDEILYDPPLRSPHHSASSISILGGGQKAKPGEVTLAHHGILFLDEILEFNRSCIEALRQPLEDRYIHISRAEHAVTYPASFLLVATMNPCPCGNLGSKKSCVCSGHTISQYQKKLSGPIVDRVDLFVKVDEVNIPTLLDNPSSTNRTPEIIKSVEEARLVQNQRNGSNILNSHLSNKQIRSLPIVSDAKKLLDSAAEKMSISPRGYFRIIKVAQTIADIDKKEKIDELSIAESLQYRQNLPTY